MKQYLFIGKMVHFIEGLVFDHIIQKEFEVMDYITRHDVHR